MAGPIPFSRPSIGDDEVAAAERVLRSGWLTTGPEAAAFEAEFGAAVGAPHAIAVNSATAGLHLALEALGVGPGDTVLVPSLTFTATAEVVRYLGAEVAFVDVDADRLVVTPATIAAAIDRVRADGGRVRAVIPVHYAGLVADMADIVALSNGEGIAVVEDCAHAFPAFDRDGNHAGTLGAVGVFSFYANKTITTGEGGMVCTADDRIADRIRTMRLHGIDRDSWARYRDPAAARRGWDYRVIAPGYKYNLPDLAAAVGRVQLKRAAALRERRAAVATRYADALGGEGGLSLPAIEGGHAWHLFVVRLRPERGAPDRDAFLDAMDAAGVACSVHYVPLHLHPYWRDRYGDADAALPVTTDLAPRIVSLPLYPDLDPRDQQYVIDTVVAALTRAGGDG